MDTPTITAGPIQETANRMTPLASGTPAWESQIHAACVQACQAIAPAWPLDRAIAVNPHWSRIGMPVRQVAARMAVLGGIQVFPTRKSQQRAWDAARISAADLNHALAKVSGAQATLTHAKCLEALHTAPTVAQLPLLIEVLDNDPKRHTRLSWRQAITHQVSQTCAAYFDQHQADWQPERSEGLYAFWLDTLQHDHGIGLLMGLPKLGQALEALPRTPQDAERWVFQRLGLPQAVWADYLEAVLLTVNGWASWCAYLGWQAGLEGGEDPHLRELLAIRLAWGAKPAGMQRQCDTQPDFYSTTERMERRASIVETGRGRIAGGRGVAGRAGGGVPANIGAQAYWYHTHKRSGARH